MRGKVAKVLRNAVALTFPRMRKATERTARTEPSGVVNPIRRERTAVKREYKRLRRDERHGYFVGTKAFVRSIQKKDVEARRKVRDARERLMDTAITKVVKKPTPKPRKPRASKTNYDATKGTISLGDAK